MGRGRGAGTSPAALTVAHALRADGFDASEDGTGRGTPIIPEVSPALKARDYKGPSSDGDGDGAPIIPTVAASLTRGAESSGKGGYAGRRQEDDTNIIAFNAKMGDHPTMGRGVIEDGSSYTLDANGISTAIAFDTTQITSAANRSNPQPGDPSHPIPAHGHAPALAFSIMPMNSGKDYKARVTDVAQPIMAGGSVSGAQGGDVIAAQWAVRRLTPTECERLQGFPPGYTQIPRGNKPTADGPRYKALGNSMAVNCMRVLGQRIQMVEDL